MECAALAINLYLYLVEKKFVMKITRFSDDDTLACSVQEDYCEENIAWTDGDVTVKLRK